MYYFGATRLDVARRLLISGNTATPVPERLLSILVVLLRANGEIVDRDTLAREVWGEAGVTRTNLAQHIYLLRVLLGERETGQSLVRTVVGRGYRFALPVTLAPQAQERYAPPEPPAVPRDRDRDRLRLYSLGCAHLEKRTAPSLRNAIGYFESALRLDAGYAHALIGLSRAYAMLAEDMHAPATKALARAKSASALALEAAPSSSTAFALRAEIALFADWDWSQAERDVETAVRLNPDAAAARAFAAWLRALKGDAQTAVAEARRTLVLQPGSASAMLLVSRILTLDAKYAEALDWLAGITSIAPEFSFAKRLRDAVLVLDRRYEEAIAGLQRVEEDPGNAYALPLLAQAYAGIGDRARARDAYARLAAIASRGYVSCWHLGVAAIAAGNTQDALGYLERAYADRECALLLVHRMPWFAGLESSDVYRTICAAAAVPA